MIKKNMLNLKQLNAELEALKARKSAFPSMSSIDISMVFYDSLCHLHTS